MDTSSKYATDFIDLTLLNTPNPQATSTVQRKRMGSYSCSGTNASNWDFKINTSNLVDADIPTRDTDTQSSLSHQSLTSSLGILSLENVEDINEVLLRQKLIDNSQENLRKSNINESLEKQRLLAQKAIKRMDSVSNSNIAGLPEYLLKPTQTGINNTVYTATPSKNESTINLSDLERSLPQKVNKASDVMSFEVKEISARSSSLSSKMKQSHGNITIETRSPSPACLQFRDVAAKYQNIREQLRQSDASIAALCDRSSRMGMRTQPLGSLFLPDIDTIDLSSTCASWTNVPQDSLVAKLQDELFTPAELADDKLLADELSWRKARDFLPTEFCSNKVDNHLNISCFSGYIGDTDVSIKSSENERVSISEFFKRRTEDVEELNLKSSPKKKHVPVPLINLTDTILNDEAEINTKQKDCRMSTDSIFSVSQIANLVSNMETPTRALNMLLKKSAQNNQNSSTNTSNIDLKSNSTEKTSKTGEILSESRNNSTLKENSNTFYSNNKLARKYNNEILRDSTNLLNMSPGNEWTDAKPNSICLVENHESISSTAESPSYSCSELEFSEDDKTPVTSNLLIGNWLHIDNSEPCKLYVNIPQDVSINLTSKTNHWLHVKLSKDIISLNCNGRDIAKVEILNKDGLLEPYMNGQFLLRVTSLVPGKFNILIKVEVIDTISGLKQLLDHTIIIESEEPKIKALSELLDFKLIPEGTIKRLMLPFRNESEMSFSIFLTIVQEYDGVFVFGSDVESDFDKDNKIDINHQIILTAASIIAVPVEMRGFALENLGVNPGVDNTTVHGSLRMHLGDSTKILQEIRLTGRVGYTKVQFKTSCMPFVLLPGQTKPMPVRNSGVVPLDLSVRVTLPDTEENSESTDDNPFTLDKTNLVLKPGQQGTVNITFKAEDRAISVKRMLTLGYPRGPNFVLPIEGIVDSCSPNVWSGASPRLDSPGSGSSSTSHSSTASLHSLPDGKLPIESTRTELVWGCVRPGRSNVQDFVLRNRCSQRLRLQAVIQGSHAFKFMKEHGDNASINLVLHSLESRTIQVSFCPSSKGSASARLMFLPIDNNTSHTKRQMIQLYGYGGHISVDVQKVAKDTSGRMWLSFGRLDYQNTLHQTFILRNTGSLAAFACLSVTCKALYPFMDSSVNIFPNEAVIEPNKEIEISVNFNPRPEDFKYIQNTTAVEVSEIASIKIMTGPEPTRGRIRRIFNKLNSNNNSNGVITQLTSAFVVPRLSAEFPDELIPSDVSICRESSGALRDLLRDVDTRELILTVERSRPDHTAVGAILDNTLMFQSLVVADNTALNITGRASGGFCSVEPRRLSLSPAEQGIVLVRSHHSRPMPFEVSVPAASTDAGLHISPLIGVVSPGDVASINICYTSISANLPNTCTLMIYVENEVMKVELSIQNTQFHRS